MLRSRRSGHESRLDRAGFRSRDHAARPPLWGTLRRRFRVGLRDLRRRGGTLKGISKPGEVVWSRVFVDGGKLKVDLGRVRAIELPREETERRWRNTTPQWPIMHAVTPGITRDQMMARHMSNHIQVAYAPDAEGATLALAAKAAAFRDMGLDVYICGSIE